MSVATITRNTDAERAQPLPLLPDDLSVLLTKHVQEQPQRIALGTSDFRIVITYRQLDTLVKSAAAQLSRLGLQQGDTVALLSDNCVEFAVGFLAVVSSGARVAPLNPALTPPGLNTRLAAIRARALLVPKQEAGQLELGQTAAGSAVPWILSVENPDGAPEVYVANLNGRQETDTPSKRRLPGINSDDIALVMFTAGSTSAPKAVPLTHRNVVESIRAICAVYHLSPKDATLIVMPLFHGHGLVAGLLATLASGGSAYLPASGRFSAHLFWPEIVRTGASWYTAVPTIHRILLNRASAEYPSSSPPALRFIRSCSAALEEDLAVASAQVFRAPMIGAYGMTETSHQATSNPLPADGTNKMTSVGRPTGIELRINGGDGREAAIGAIGEVWVRGATVTAGYLDNPTANSASFIDGWFRTGDLGSRDADGYLFLKGRLKELINRGGEKISPGDIEAALLSNPKVFEAESFGEPDPLYGENVNAAVVLRSGAKATESELLDYCRSRLSSFEVPKRIHIVIDFPLTAKGSIDRRALAAQFAREQ